MSKNVQKNVWKSVKKTFGKMSKNVWKNVQKLFG